MLFGLSRTRETKGSFKRGERAHNGWAGGGSRTNPAERQFTSCGGEEIRLARVHKDTKITRKQEAWRNDPKKDTKSHLCRESFLVSWLTLANQSQASQNAYVAKSELVIGRYVQGRDSKTYPHFCQNCSSCSTSTPFWNLLTKSFALHLYSWSSHYSLSRPRSNPHSDLSSTQTSSRNRGKLVISGVRFQLKQNHPSHLL